MPIEPVKIPQNVYIEDRIVGPLTLRQIIIMAIGGGFSYMMYASVQKTLGHVGIPLTILLWTPAAIAAAFALIKVNDLSLLRICFLLLERLNKPGLRTFAPRQGISIVIHSSWFQTTAKDEKAKNQEEKKQQDAHRDLRELGSLMDRVPTIALSDGQQATITEMPTETSAPLATIEESQPQPQPSSPTMNRTTVKANGTPPTPETPELSDLTVFRDLLPPQTPWH